MSHPSKQRLEACRTSAGNTILHAAATSGHIHMTNELLRRRAWPDVRNLQGESPLHLACEQSNVELTRLLLSFQADPRLGDVHGNRVPGLRAVMKRVAWWSEQQPSGLSSVDQASAAEGVQQFLERRLETVKVCLEAMESWDGGSAAASLLDTHGETALHLAAAANDISSCRLLLEFRATVDAEAGVEGRTPLMYAVRAGVCPAVVRCLLEALADPNRSDTDGKSALHHAASCGDTAVNDVTELLRKRAEANATDAQGSTALSLAAQVSSPELMRLLLRKGATPQSCRALLSQIADDTCRDILHAVL